MDFQDFLRELEAFTRQGGLACAELNARLAEALKCGRGIPQASVFDDWGLTSLQAEELRLLVEEIFGVEIPDEVLYRGKLIGPYTAGELYHAVFLHFVRDLAGFVCEDGVREVLKSSNQETVLSDVCDSPGEVEIQMGIEEAYGVKVDCSFFATRPTLGSLWAEVNTARLGTV